MSYCSGSVSIAAVLATAAAAVLPASALGAPAIAPPSTVACGATITHNVTLAGDVNCPATFRGAALTIGADDLTLDLNGYTVSRSTGSSGQQIETGILDAGHQHVVIRNGTIKLFATGIELRGGGASEVQDVSAVTGSTTSPVLVVRNGRDFTITHSNLGGAGTAIRVIDSPGTTISDTTADSTFEAGIELQSNNDVVHHDSTDSQGASVLLEGSDNQVVDTIGSFEVFSGDGNVIHGGKAEAGINRSGMVIGADASDTTVESIVADDNAPDGIDAESPSTTLIDDTADDNYFYGIYAVPGVTGRGNEASGNGFIGPPKPQCVNIKCS